MPTTPRADRLDREAGLFLRVVSPLVGQPIRSEQVSTFRRSWRLLAVTLGRRVPVASIVERRIDGPGGQITLRVYTPKGPAGLKPALQPTTGGYGSVVAHDSNRPAASFEFKTKRTQTLRTERWKKFWRSARK